MKYMAGRFALPEGYQSLQLHLYFLICTIGCTDFSIFAKVIHHLLFYISLFKVLFFLQTSFLSALWLSALPPRQVPKRSAIPIRAHSLRSALHIEGRHAGIYRSIAQLLLDAQKLVVFCHTLGSARCAGLDLAGV